MYDCNYNHEKKQSGFTLLEITFVFLIFGLIVAMFSPLYSLYLKNQAELTTQQNTDLTVTEITEFLNVHGRYPCPAPLGGSREDTMTVGTDTFTVYGRESTECAASAAGSPTIATGACDASTGTRTSGICVETSQRVGVPQATRVIIGAVPFRELNMPEEQSYDGYGNRLTYAVTEVLTQDGNYEPNLGGIRIVDANNEDVDDNNAIHFLVYSHGENGYGAYNNFGVQLSCAGVVGEEAENCFGAGGNAEFKLANRSTNSGDATEYDDVAAFVVTDDIPHFKLAGEGGDIEFMGAPDGGRLGMLLPAGIEALPEQELDVGGNVRAQTDLKADQVCTYGNESECFNTELIAGDVPAMECPAGQYMVGMENNHVVCQEEIIPQCGPGKYLVGVKADGTIKCAPYDVPECPWVEVDLCPGHPGTYTLPVGQNGNIVTARERDLPTVDRAQKYKCVGSSWQPHGGAWGTCSCIAGEEISRTPKSCEKCMFGGYDKVKRRTCPSGSVTVKEGDTCACDPATPCYKSRPISCRSGYILSGAPIKQDSLFNCKANGKAGHPKWGPWVTRPEAGTCICDMKAPAKSTKSCNTYSITLTEKVPGEKVPTIRYFDCSKNPPAYGPVLFDEARAPASLAGKTLFSNAVKDHYCECNGSLAPQKREVSCSSRFPGTTGVIDEKRDYDCGTETWSAYYPDHASLDASSTGEEIKDTFCTPVRPVICRWNKDTSLGTGPVRLGEERGSICDCNMDAADKIGNCHDVLPGGTTFKNYSGCTCG